MIKSISVSINGDAKSVDWKDGEKRIKLTEQANKTIVGEITQPKDGKSVTEKIEVKDVTELKTKFPEAFEVYEKHLVKRDATANKIGNAEVIKNKSKLCRNKVKRSANQSRYRRSP